MFKPARPDQASAYRFGGMLLFLATGSILAALGFEYIGGYQPCPLCLMQRYAYYIAIPLSFLAMAFAMEKPKLAGALFLGVAVAFIANAGLGIYHAGAEWKYWPGPATCSMQQALPTSAADLLQGLDDRVVRCDEASWRMFGLSFAGWNVIISAVLAGLALKAASTAAANRI
jgi:disulfide bond formation protein DsbB